MRPLNKKVLSIVATLILFLIFGLFFSLNSNKTSFFDREAVVVEVKEQILNSFDGENLSIDQIQITHLSSKYARAENSQSGNDLFLINNNDSWQIVFNTAEPVFCERAERFGFPAGFIQDCVLEFSEAIDLSEYEDTEEEGDQAQIIANLADVQDPFCDCLIFEDEDGEEVFFNYEGGPDINPGDTVVIVVEDDEIIEIIEVINDDVQDYEDDEGSENTPIIYINDDPEVAPKDDNLIFLDIDRSAGEIQLITDL